MTCWRLTPLGLALLLGSATLRAEGSTNVDALYVEGVKLLAKGELEGAVERFERALAIKRTAPLLFNFGQAKLKLGRLVEAKRAFTEAVAVAEKDGPKAIVDLASSSLAELQDRVPSISVERPKGVSGVAVRLDGKKLDTTDAVDVEPGRHEVVVEKDGYAPYRVTLDLREGDRERVEPRLQKIGEAEDTAPSEAPADSRSSLPVGPIVLGGVGLAAVGGAVYFYMKMKSLDEERTALWKDSGCPGPSCPNGEPDGARTLRENAESKARAGNVLLGVGAAALVGSGVWYYFASKSPKQERAAIVVSPLPGGAVVSGQF
jgi:tetratricopeptide (TPR) repeat protein